MSDDVNTQSSVNKHTQHKDCEEIIGYRLQTGVNVVPHITQLIIGGFQYKSRFGVLDSYNGIYRFLH